MKAEPLSDRREREVLPIVGTVERGPAELLETRPSRCGTSSQLALRLGRALGVGAPERWELAAVSPATMFVGQ